MELARILTVAGLIAPAIFLFEIWLGARLREPYGYTHTKNTVSELFTAEAPNRILLVSLHLMYAALTSIFGWAAKKFFEQHSQANNKWEGTVAAKMIIITGIINMFTVTIFPQDPTITGIVHIILVIVLIICALGSTFLVAVWSVRFSDAAWEGGTTPSHFDGFSIYSFITCLLIIFSCIGVVTSSGESFVGVTERISVLICLQWNFFFALALFRFPSKTGPRHF